MSFAPVANQLDPNDFVIVPHVAVLDEFDMTDDDENVIARIDANYIAKTVAQMNRREARTGDLSPIIIGHTPDEPFNEVDGPPLVGYQRNWVQDAFFNETHPDGTPKTAAFADFWIFKQDVARAAKFSRRSGEVWVNKHEIDPTSLLGATTPCRDLGLMVIKLSRNGSMTVPAPVEGGLFDRPVRLSRTPTNRESTMPDEKKTDAPKEEAKNPKPPADASQSGANKALEGMLQQVLAAIQALTDKVGCGAATPTDAASPTAAAGAAGAAGAGGEEQELGDDELNALLAQYDQGAKGCEEDEGCKPAPKAEPKEAPAEEEGDEDDAMSRKGEKVVKNSTGYPGGNDTSGAEIVKKLARQDEEIAVLRSQVARAGIKEQLLAAQQQGAAIDPNDETLVTSLSIMPPDVRKDMIVRLSRQKSITSRGGHAGNALGNATTGLTGKRVETAEQKTEVVKLARSKGINFEEAAKELGFTTGM